MVPASNFYETPSPDQRNFRNLCAACAGGCTCCWTELCSPRRTRLSVLKRCTTTRYSPLRHSLLQAIPVTLNTRHPYLTSHSSPHGMPLKIAQDLFSLGEVDHLLDAHQVVRTWILVRG